MKTKAHFKGHAIHPMLIPFPIAFLSGAFVCDVVGRLFGVAAWWQTGAYMAIAGIATALLAAIPGLIDYFYAVPPQSTGKKRATYHMLSNVGSVALFAVAWLVRGSAAAAPGAAVLLLEAAGVVLLTMGGWMGGTLVYRNFVGPEHRYAGAGKWKEQSVEGKQGEPILVAKGDELEPDQMKLLRIDGRRIVLGRTAEGYVAFDDHCTHRGGSLAGGVMMCGRVQCLWHGSQFDVSTGEVRSGPAEKPISTYRVEERDGKVWLTM